MVMVRIQKQELTYLVLEPQAARIPRTWGWPHVLGHQLLPLDGVGISAQLLEAVGDAASECFQFPSFLCFITIKMESCSAVECSLEGPSRSTGPGYILVQCWMRCMLSQMSVNPAKQSPYQERRKAVLPTPSNPLLFGQPSHVSTSLKDQNQISTHRKVSGVMQHPM